MITKDALVYNVNKLGVVKTKTKMETMQCMCVWVCGCVYVRMMRDGQGAR